MDQEKILTHLNNLDDLLFKITTVQKSIESIQNYPNEFFSSKEEAKKEIERLNDELSKMKEEINYSQAFISASGYMVTGSGEMFDPNNMALN